MITYNHEKFIARAIESVLNQQTNFAIELVIGEDHSQDKTAEICEQYQRQYPEKIKAFCQKINVGMNQNFVYTLQRCQGKYIAICDGDDYWVDNRKLQKQVDFLENNPDYVIHSANAQMVTVGNATQVVRLLHNLTEPDVFETKDFLTTNHLATCTVMCRNITISQRDYWLQTVKLPDWFYYVMLLQQHNQKAYRTQDCMAAYQMHTGSTYNTMSIAQIHETHIDQINMIRQYTKLAIEDEGDIRRLTGRFIGLYRIYVKELHIKKLLKKIVLHYRMLGLWLWWKAVNKLLVK